MKLVESPERDWLNRFLDDPDQMDRERRAGEMARDVPRYD
jgi:hypothetical protein